MKVQKTSKTAIGAAVIMLVLGVLVGFALANMTSSESGGFIFGSTPPAGHLDTAAKISVRDNTFNTQLTAVFIRGGESRPLSLIPLAFVGKIKYSVWEFRADANDASTVLAAMLIWGPDDGGKYFVEIGRLSPNAYTVMYPGGPTGGHVWGQGGNDGFVYVLI
jgi:hypothetical protein